MDEVRGSRGSAADSESLILVDEADREVGHLDKAQCHQGRGVLHRAFSLFIFNDAGELLLQQRAASKRLWPLYPKPGPSNRKQKLMMKCMHLKKYVINLEKYVINLRKLT